MEKVVSTPAFAETAQRQAECDGQNMVALTAEELTSIGYSASFAWRIAAIGELWKTSYPSVDFAIAKQCFEKAAALGYWVGLNNLALMYRDGLGISADSDKAFELLTRAAESLQPQALRNLADLYSRGIGVPVDQTQAKYLRDLADASSSGKT